MEPKCTLCELHATCKSVKIDSSGTGDIVFLGEAPGAEEDRYNRPFIGESGTFLRSMTEMLEIDPVRLRFTNAVRCRPPQNAAPKKKQIKACLTHLVDEFIENTPKIIVPLGNTALTALREAGILTVPGTIMTLHGKVIQEEDVVVLPMVHPAYILRAPEAIALYKNSMETLEKVVKEGVVPPQQCQYDLIETLPELEIALKEAVASGLVAYDIETSCLHPMDKESHEKGPFIVSFSITWRERQGVAFLLNDENREQALEMLHTQLLENPDVKKIMHHAKFELRWSMFLGRTIVNMADTMLIHWHLNEKKGTHGLEKIAADYTDMGFYDAKLEAYKADNPKCDPKMTWKDEKGNVWSGSYSYLPNEILLTYNAQDTDATYRCYQIMWPQLSEQQKWVHENIQIPTCYPLAQMEIEGVAIDWDYVDKLDEELPAKAEALVARIMSYPEVEEFQKQRVAEGKEEINFNSGDQVASLLFKYLGLKPVYNTKKGTKPSTDKGVLEYLSERHEVPKLLLERRSITTLHNNFVKGALTKRMGDRLYTSYGQTGTDTGRLNSTGPNLQNIPRSPIIKTMFIPDGDDILGQVDYSQIELRVLAIMSKDKALISYFADGLDVHRMIAAKVHKIAPEQVTKDQRTHAKRTVFGLCYGQGARGLAEELGISQRESEIFIHKFFTEFPGVKKYISATEKFVQEKGYVESLFGTVRRLPDAMIPYECRPRAEALRQAINARIQTTAALMLFYKMAELHDFIKRENLKTKIRMTVYDSLNFSIPEHEANFFLPAAKMILEDWAFLPWVNVPIVCDVEVGPNWGNLIALEGQDFESLLDGVHIQSIIEGKGTA